MLKSFNDKESKVQLAACDALFNIIRIFKEAIVKYKDFYRIFDGVIGNERYSFKINFRFDC